VRNQATRVVSEVGLKALASSSHQESTDRSTALAPSTLFAHEGGRDVEMAASHSRDGLKLVENPRSVALALPNELWQKIISHLSDTDSMENLGKTSRKMRALVSDPYITRIFLTSLAQARKDRPEVLAAQLNTPSGRAFLEDYIQKVQLDDTYQVMQKTLSLLSDLLEEAKTLFMERGGKETLGVKSFYSHKYDPSDKLYRYRTSAGFLIYSDPTSVWVCHPFGAMLVHNVNVGSSESRMTPCTEALIKRLQATFQGFCTNQALTEGEILPAGESFNRAVYEEVHRPTGHGDDMIRIDPRHIREVGRQDLEGKKGSKNLIMSSDWGHYSVYKVERAFGTLLPEARSKVSENSHDSDGLMRRTFHILETRFGKKSD